MTNPNEEALDSHQVATRSVVSTTRSRISRVASFGPQAYRKRHWACIVFVVLLTQGVPFFFVTMDQTCQLDFEHENVPFHTALVCMLPLYLTQWYLAAICGVVVDHRRYRRDSMEHNSSACYLALNIVISFTDSFQLMWRCNMQRWSDYFRYIWLGSWGLVFLSWMVLVGFSHMRLSLLAASAPFGSRFGVVVGRVLLVIIPLCYAAMVNILCCSGNALVYLILLVLVCSLIAVLLITLLGVSECSVRAATNNADPSEEIAGQLVAAGRSARSASVFLAVAGTATLVFLLCLLLRHHFSPAIGRLLVSIAYMLDVVFNVSAVLKVSGLLKPPNSVRQIVTKPETGEGSSAKSVSAIASLISGVSPVDAFTTALAKFRCVSWDNLERRPDIIVGGAPLAAIGPGGMDMYSLSEPCNLGDCDMFLSHSWHDNAELKWEAITCWCEDFRETHGRSPRLWLDKVCIDQTNIEEDLMCLPVFMAGCKTAFFLCGPTFHKRLWCAVELLVYRTLLVNDHLRSQPDLWSMAQTREQSEDCLRAFRDFDVGACECANAEDKTRFLRIVSQFPGGATRFNHSMRETAADMATPFFTDQEI
eukprot:TRINITY_DN43271_c0_g1_i1.p1 TRINITY_DN43271_c0_g1~~TRINITY_DN43271_c0_g1_i1.p1  ORF type:complete len:591 (-),score=41.72 TRINITY_DN43271_c0_g1_i1:118-1890(-)